MTVEQFTASDGAGIAFRTFGDGPRVVTALHSLSLDGSWYQALAAELGDGYRLVCPDVRGHGSTDEGPGPMTLDRIASDVIELWNHLSIASSVVLGVSMGGMIAQAVSAQAGPRVEAMVLVATGGAFDAVAKKAAIQRLAAVRAADDMSVLVQPLIERWFGADVRDDDPLVTRARETLARTSPRLHANSIEAMLEVGTYRPPGQQPPTLVIGGEDDVSSTRPVIEALAEKYPNSRLVFLPGPHLFAFTQTAALAPVVANFLDEHQPQRAGG
jgi:3-oxoadipate enol-lactonase